MMYTRKINSIRRLYLNDAGLSASSKITARARKLASETVQQSNLNSDVALLFVGSSGRGEMCFKSDVDYMILLDDVCKQNAHEITDLERKMQTTLSHAGFGKLSCFAVGGIDAVIAGSHFCLVDRLTLDGCVLC